MIDEAEFERRVNQLRQEMLKKSPEKNNKGKVPRSFFSANKERFKSSLVREANIAWSPVGKLNEKVQSDMIRRPVLRSAMREVIED